MKRSGLSGIFLALLMVWGLALAGCSKGDSSGGGDSRFLGTYDEPKEHMTLVVKADHKGTLSTEGKPGEISWEAPGGDKLVIHMATEYTLFRTADGNLRDEEGKTWTKK